jgi:hypothetical protein
LAGKLLEFAHLLCLVTEALKIVKLINGVNSFSFLNLIVMEGMGGGYSLAHLFFFANSNGCLNNEHAHLLGAMFQIYTF